MTSRQSNRPETAGTHLEFGVANRSAPPPSAGDIPRADILNYVQEMCATLSYMSIAHDCGRLSSLLAAAAAEAERQMSGTGSADGIRATLVQPRAVNSETR